MSHDPEEGVRVSAPAATVFSLSALLLSISMDRTSFEHRKHRKLSISMVLKLWKTFETLGL